MGYENEFVGHGNGSDLDISFADRNAVVFQPGANVPIATGSQFIEMVNVQQIGYLVNFRSSFFLLDRRLLNAVPDFSQSNGRQSQIRRRMCLDAFDNDEISAHPVADDIGIQQVHSGLIQAEFSRGKGIGSPEIRIRNKILPEPLRPAGLEQRLKYNLVALLSDFYRLTFKAKRFGQANRLRATVLKKLCG